MDPIRYQLYSDTSARLPTFLAHASVAQELILPDGSGSLSDRLVEHQETLLGELADYRGFEADHDERWRLRDAFIDAQSYFAWLDCRAARSEDSLTGSLISQLGSAILRINEQPAADLRLPPVPLALWTIELVLSGREQRTGGDLAVLVEESGRVFVSCFQAKRADSAGWSRGATDVDISRPENCIDEATGKTIASNHLRQFLALRQLPDDAALPISCGYIFYDNGVNGTPAPALPLVKRIEDFDTQVYNTRKADLGSKAVDLASHMFRLIGDKDAAIAAEPDQLYRIARALAEYRFAHIVCAGSDRNFVNRLARSFERVPDAKVKYAELTTRPQPRVSDDLQWPIGLALTRPDTQNASPKPWGVI